MRKAAENTQRITSFLLAVALLISTTFVGGAPIAYASNITDEISAGPTDIMDEIEIEEEDKTEGGDDEIEETDSLENPLGEDGEEIDDPYTDEELDGETEDDIEGEIETDEDSSLSDEVENVFAPSSFVGTLSTGVEVSNETELLAAIAAKEAKIKITADITLTDALYIDYDVTLTGDKSDETPAVITSATGKRHIVVSDIDMTLTLEDVVLDGGGVSGGIKAVEMGAITINGGVIRNCLSTDIENIIEYDTTSTPRELKDFPYTSGGALYAYNTSLTINNTELSTNRAENGGAIFFMRENDGAANNHKLTLTGNTAIKNNNADYNGAGLFVITDHGEELARKDPSIILRLQDNVEINGNTATHSGGGALVAYGSVEVTGNAIISDNEAQYKNDATAGYAAPPTQGISARGGGGMLVFSSNSLGHTCTINGNVYFADNTAYHNGGGLLVTDMMTTISGNVSFVDNKAAQFVSSSNTGGTQGSSIGGGGLFFKYTMTDTDTAPLRVSGKVTFDGNSAILTRTAKSNLNGNGGGIYAQTRMVEISGDVAFNENEGYNGGGFCIFGSGNPEVTISGNVSFTDNKAFYDGGAVFTGISGIVTNLKGSTAEDKGIVITGNAADYNGGGCRANSINTTGNVSISENIATNSGGGIYSAYVDLDGSTILEKNESKYTSSIGYGGGGAVCFTNTIVTAGDVIIRENTAVYGGGIAASGTRTATVGGNTLIIKNTSSKQGGGVCIVSGTVIANDKAKITENTSKSYGGGIYATTGSVTLNNKASISENTASISGGGIYITTGKVTANDEAQIVGNKATSSLSGNGGGIYTSGLVELNDKVQVKDNTAAVHGGGIYRGTSTASLENVTAAAGVTFGGNTAKTVGLILDADKATHAEKILVTPAVFSVPTLAYAYNNYDINYANNGYYMVNVLVNPADKIPVGAAKAYITDSNSAATTVFAKKDETVTLAATNQAGFTFENWTGEDTIVDSEALTTTFVMPTKNVTVTANYATQAYTVTTLASPEGAGTATAASTANDIEQASEISVYEGYEIELVATANDGYRFVGWQVTTGDMQAAAIVDGAFTMPGEDLVLTAMFEKTGGTNPDPDPDPEYRYTISHLDIDTKKTVAPSDTGKAKEGTVINAADYVKDIKNYEYDSVSVDSITIEKSGNNITIYYKKTAETGFSLAHKDEFTFDVSDKRPEYLDKSLSWAEFAPYLEAIVTNDITGETVTGVTLIPVDYDTVNYDVITLQIPGSYPFAFDAEWTDKDGEHSLRGHAVIHIVDRIAPIITVETSPVIIQRGIKPVSINALLKIGGVSVVDNYDDHVDILTNMQPIAFEDIDWDKVDEYAVLLNATDISGNKAEQKILVIQIRDENPNNPNVPTDPITPPPGGSVVIDEDGNIVILDEDGVPLSTIPFEPGEPTPTLPDTGTSNYLIPMILGTGLVFMLLGMWLIFGKNLGKKKIGQ